MDWTGIKVKTAPALEPVTVSELKTFLSLDASTYDTMLSGYITACRQAIETYTGRTLITTSYQLMFDSFPDIIELARPPVQSITSITYVDTDGVTQTLSSSLYRTDLISLFGRIEPAYGESWPSIRNVSNAVTVEFKCGYGDAAASVPDALKVAIMSLAADMFEHREANFELNLQENRTYKFLLDSHKIARCV